MWKSKAFVLLTVAALVLMVGGGVSVADDDDDDRGHGRNYHSNYDKKYHKHKDPQASLRNEFALFDGSNPANQPDAGAICGALRKPFTYHLAVANYGSDGFVRITYIDGDWIQFPIAARASFSLTQAGGSKGGNDAVVRVSNGDSAAQLAGVMSASGAKCGSCDAIAEGGIGDAQCDTYVPN